VALDAENGQGRVGGHVATADLAGQVDEGGEGVVVRVAGAGDLPQRILGVVGALAVAGAAALAERVHEAAVPRRRRRVGRGCAAGVRVVEHGDAGDRAVDGR